MRLLKLGQSSSCAIVSIVRGELKAPDIAENKPVWTLAFIAVGPPGAHMD